MRLAPAFLLLMVVGWLRAFGATGGDDLQTTDFSRRWLRDSINPRTGRLILEITNETIVTNMPMTGTGFLHITDDLPDPEARAVDLSTDDVIGNLDILHLDGGLNANVNTFLRGDGKWSEVPANGVTPAGTGFTHNTGGTQDPDARAVDLSTPDVVGNLDVSHLDGGVGASAMTYWRGDKKWAPITGASGGTVTSVDVVVPGFMTVSGGPITTAGIITIGLSGSKLPITSVGAPSGNGFGHVTSGIWDPAAKAVDLSTVDVTGNLPVTHLNSGITATDGTFWRGDGVWTNVLRGNFQTLEGGMIFSSSGFNPGTGPITYMMHNGVIGSIGVNKLTGTFFTPLALSAGGLNAAILQTNGTITINYGFDSMGTSSVNGSPLIVTSTNKLQTGGSLVLSHTGNEGVIESSNYTGGYKPLSLKTGGAERMRILTNGQVNVLNGLDTVSGYTVGGAAALGNYLRGNGTAFVSSSLLASDLTGTIPIGSVAAPTGTGFGHITGGLWDAAARAVDLGTADATGTIASARVSGNYFGITGVGTLGTPLHLTGAPDVLSLENSDHNWIMWNGQGIGPPTMTNRSPGTKVVLYPSINNIQTDYAMGVEPGAMWFGISQPGSSFKWYGGTNVQMSLNSGVLKLDTGAFPNQSQFKITAAGAGGVSLFAYSTNNSALTFDADFNGGWIARATSASLLYKGSDILNFYGDTGLTNGATYTPTIRMALGLGTGILNTFGGYTVGGSAAAGKYLRGNGTAFVSSSLLASDVTGSLPPSAFAGGLNADTSTFWRGDNVWTNTLGATDLLITLTGTNSANLKLDAGNNGDVGILFSRSGVNAWHNFMVNPSTSLSWYNNGGFKMTLNTSGVLDTSAGYTVGTAAVVGKYLRGNGTAFVSSSLLASDLSGTIPIGSVAAPTGTGFGHITGGVWDGASKAVDLSGADATGVLAAARHPALAGDVTSVAGSLTTTLANTAVTPGTYGDATHVAQVAIDSKGRATSAVNVSIFANQGSTSTVLHGNASGVPSFGPVNLFTETIGVLPSTSVPAYTGDVTSPAGSTVNTLSASGVAAGTYGDATHTLQATIDSKGRVTAAASVAITGTGGSTPPSGTGFTHITSGAQDPAARAVDLSGTDVTGILAPSHVAGNYTGITGVGTLGTPLHLTGGPDVLSLENSDHNWIMWNGQGIGPPTMTNRSVGTKLVLYPAVNNVQTDFGMGVEPGAMWFGISQPGSSFKWYGGTNVMMALDAGVLKLDTGAFPNQSQFKITAAGAGGVSLFNYSANNSAIGFDADFNGGWVARATSASLIYKLTDVLNFYGDTGLTPGSIYTSTIRMTLGLGTGILNTTGGYTVGGAAATGKYLRGNGTAFVSSSLLASDLSGTIPIGNVAAPTGTGFGHVTGGVWDGASKAVDLSGADATGVLAAARHPALAGDVTSVAGSLTTTLANTAVTPGTYGSATTVPVVTVDSKGRVTAATTATITAPANTGVFPIKVVTANYTFTAADYTVVANVSPGITLTLPSATANPGKIFIAKGGYLAPGFTIAPGSGDFIDNGGALSVTGGTQAALMVQSDGGHQWYLLQGAYSGLVTRSTNNIAAPRTRSAARGRTVTR